MSSDSLLNIKAALQKAVVSIYEEIQEHNTWTSEHLSGTNTKYSSNQQNVNASGDKVLALDVIADSCVEEALRECEEVAGFASEEREGFVSLNPGGTYIVVYDPLDGSQNVPVGVSVGAIFGIFKAKTLKDIVSGDDLVASAYALFSAPLLFCFGDRKSSVSFFQYSFGNKLWEAIIQDHKIPEKGKTYCINEGNCGNWDRLISAYVAQCLRGRSVRWTCCMVVDVHRPLLQGGCFLYPADKKYPLGRLRLVYEAYPMAFLWEKAGGTALENKEGDRILSRAFPHDDIHARTGVILLGPGESKRFNHMKKNLPTWNGGSVTARVAREQTKVDDAVKDELRYLKIALVIGAIIQIGLFLRN